MYLRTLKAARSANFFWEEIFMPKSQLGGILYIFPPGDLIKIEITQSVSKIFACIFGINSELS